MTTFGFVCFFWTYRQNPVSVKVNPKELESRAIVQNVYE